MKLLKCKMLNDGMNLQWDLPNSMKRIQCGRQNNLFSLFSLKIASFNQIKQKTKNYEFSHVVTFSQYYAKIYLLLKFAFTRKSFSAHLQDGSIFSIHIF